MPRNGAGVYSLPAGSTVTNGDVSDASDVNTPFSDLETDMNTVRPIVAGGTGASSASAARTALGLAIGTDVQAYDAGLASIAGLTTAADRMIYTTASDTYAVATLTAAGRAILDDADAAAQRTTLGLGALATAANITTAEIEAATLVTSTDTVASNDNDTTIPTSAAVIDYVPVALNASGSAPIYACRAWGSLNATTASGTYSRTGNTVTVTITGHNMSTGQGVYLDFTSGTATDGYYTVTVIDANTFTVTDAASGATSGNVTRILWLRAGGNIASATRVATGIFAVTMSIAMSDTFYAALVSGNSANDDSAGDLNDWFTVRVVSTTTFNVRCYDQSGTVVNPVSFYFAVFR